MSSSTLNTDTFTTLHTHLTTTYAYPLLASTSPYPHSAPLSHRISSLSLHPTLEALLHILNADLASAHFLCRHMQSPPAWEGMFIHGLLHRVEGDIENAKAWYRDVAESECFVHVWPEGVEAAVEFLEGVKMVRGKDGAKVDREKLDGRSRREFEAVVDWCAQKFGTARLENASDAWVEPTEKHREEAAKMVVGGEGWRKF